MSHTLLILKIYTTFKDVQMMSKDFLISLMVSDFQRSVWECSAHICKGQKKSKWFFQVDVSSLKRTNEFYFTTMKPQVDLFSFVFWRKLKSPKRHFEIIWPLVLPNWFKAIPINVIFAYFIQKKKLFNCLKHKIKNS